MEYEIVNKIEPAVYNRFRESVGWGGLAPDQAEVVLSNSIQIACVSGGETIAITRILWDGGYTAYIADVIVDEKHRGKGLGKLMVNRALEEIRNRMKPGWKCKILLLAAKGKEPFYEKFGFVCRPNDMEGCGMNMVYTKE